MASLDQQLDVRAQEMSGHGDAAAIRENCMWIIGEFLDVTENIVPASGIQARGMLPQFIEDFIHLESSQDRLNKNSGLDRSSLQSHHLLRMEKHVVPETRLEVAFHFGQIKIRTCSARKLFLRVVPEEK